MRIFVTVLAFIATFDTYAQVVGGHAIFDFLNVPVNAHVAGLGAQNVSVFDRDPSLFMSNPALLNKKMDKRFSLNYLPYLADVKAISLAGAYNIPKAGLFSVGFKYLDYGQMDQRTESADFVGTFGSKDYAIVVGKSHTIGNFTLGMNAKFLGSELISYKTYAWAVDAGVLFKHPKEDFTVGMAIKNMGKVVKKYTPTSKDSLPFDVQIGSSYKFRHAPLRVSLTGHTLNKWDIVYNDPNFSTKVDEEGNAEFKKVRNAERLMRHLTFALEILPIKYVDIRFGYNYLMSRELSLTDGISAAGISLGGCVRFDRYEAGFTHTIIHRSGGSNVFTVNVDLGSGYKRL